MIDFTNCERDFYRSFNGANGQKISLLYAGHRYMVKFPSKKNGTTYINSCLSEHIACNVLRISGLDCQETLLGTFDDGSKVRTVVACRDFTESGLTFSDFGSLKNMCIQTTENGYGTELSDIESAFSEQQWVDEKELKSFFWDMFVGDALIGNFDRHNGNWGFVIDPVQHNAHMAPIFDCGSSLYPQLPVEQYESVLSSRAEIEARIYTFPNSAIQTNGRKINYHEFITSCSDPGCNAALLRTVPRIDMEKVKDFIDSCEPLSEIQKEFYFTMLLERKTRILDPGFEKAESIGP